VSFPAVLSFLQDGLDGTLVLLLQHFGALPKCRVADLSRPEIKSGEAAPLQCIGIAECPCCVLAVCMQHRYLNHLRQTDQVRNGPTARPRRFCGKFLETDLMQTRRIELILLSIGLTLLTMWGGAWIYRGVSSRVGIMRFEAGDVHAQNMNPTRANDVASGERVDFTLWSEKRMAAYKDSLSGKTDAPLAVLVIRKINLKVPVYNDTDDQTLNRGVGRILGTAKVGEAGNLGIAGHRDGFFRGLKDLAPKDEIELRRPRQSDTYVIDQISLVDPRDVSVLKPTQVPSVTLVTCYPFYYVGSAPQRYIVRASIKDSDRVDHEASHDPQPNRSAKKENTK
jgi:sortase A